MAFGLTAAILAGAILLAGILFRRWMRAAARFLFAPDADEEWMAPIAMPRAAGGHDVDEMQHCRGPSAGGKLG